MKRFCIVVSILCIVWSAASQVNPEWSVVYNSPLAAGDFSTAITTDKEGNVLVSGAGVNPASNTTDGLVVKYNGDGDFQWAMVHSGSGNWDDAFNAIATDDEGNVYVTGFSDEGQTNKDFVTVMLRSGGVEVWKSYYRGLGSDDDDYATAIAVDKAGNVLVTGSSAGYSSTNWTDFATIKYSPAGDTLWTARAGGSGLPNDRATALATDNSGYTYVTGYMEGPVEVRYNYATIKYTPYGDTAWLRIYNGSGSDEDRACAVALDAARNVFVTGTSWGNGDDFATLKYDSAGTLQWVARYNGPGNSSDKATGMVTDHAGNVYVTGYSAGTGFNYDYLTIKYNNEGDQEWVARYNGPDNYNDYAQSVAVDQHGNVFVTGYSENAPSPFISTTDVLTIKYNPLGEEQWIHRYNGQGNYHDQGKAVTVAEDGSAYIAGRTDNYQQINSSDVVILKFADLNDADNGIIKPGDYIIYPNPAGNCFIFSLKSGTQEGIIEIFSLTGEVVYCQSIRHQTDIQIDISSLTTGVYACLYKADNRLPAIRKLVIAR